MRRALARLGETVGQITVEAIGDGLVALPLGGTFVTQRNIIDPRVQAV